MGVTDTAIARSVCGSGEETTTEADALLSLVLGSSVSDVTEAFAVRVVLPGVSPFTCTTNEKRALAPLSRLAIVADTFPVLPTAGVERVQLFGAVKETNVVESGTAVVTMGFLAASGPLFVTVNV